MRRWTAMGLAALLSACVPATIPLPDLGPPVPALVARPVPPAEAAAAARAFDEVVARVEPVAEALCRARTRNVECDMRFLIDPRPALPPNAYQTLDDRGRAVIGLTQSLVRDARNADELAFVTGHEAAHHIAGHIPRQADTALRGALVAGVLATLAGADEATVREIQRAGAELGARTYSRAFELEADALGTEIAWRAGYDPLRGAAFFARLPDPGDRALPTHPPNALRVTVVRDTLERLGADLP